MPVGISSWYTVSIPTLFVPSVRRKRRLENVTLEVIFLVTAYINLVRPS